MRFASFKYYITIFKVLISFSYVNGQKINNWSEYKTSYFQLLIPNNWQVIKHSENSIECVEKENDLEKGRLYIAINPINDNYDINRHKKELVGWIQNLYQTRTSQHSIDESFTSSFIGTLNLLKKNTNSKANIRIFTLGYEVLTCVYVKSINDFNEDLKYYRIFNSLMRSFHSRQNLIYTPKGYKIPTTISNSKLLGSWFYGNTHRITTENPGYAYDIVIESTKAIDNAGLNYSFYQDDNYRLTYKSSSRASYGTMNMSFIELGKYKIEGQVISFYPKKLVGRSNVNSDQRTYNYLSKDLEPRKGIIQEISPDKIRIKEPCALLMTETWCSSGKLYFIEYQQLNSK